MQTPDQVCIRHKKDLESIRDEWEEVFENCLVKSTFLSFDYVNLWYDCFAAPDRVRVYRLEEAGKTFGFLPLVLNTVMGFRVINSLTNDHSFHGGPLVCAGHESRLQEVLLQGLMATKSGWDVFRDAFAYSFSIFPELLPEALLIKKDMKWEKQAQPSYMIRVERPFEFYLQSGISPKVRKNFRPDRNRLAKAGKVTFLHYRDFEALNHWRTFISIEDSGWKGRARSSISKLGDNYQRYYRGLVHLLARNEALNLYFLDLNGEPIAGAFCYQDGSVLHYAKTGYDEKFSAFGPSNMLLLHIIEDLATNIQEVQVLHMFPWDYGYKHRYANEEAFCTETTLYSKTVGGHAAWLLKRIKQYMTSLAASLQKRRACQT